MSYTPQDNAASQRKIGIVVVSIILLLAIVPITYGLIEELGANDVMVVQSPLTGNLTWHTTPGPKWQGFGKVTKYKVRDQFWFQVNEEDHRESGTPIEVRFNDGGHGKVHGSLAWEIPLDEKALTEIHRRYGSHLALENQLVKPVVEKSVYMTGPLMSSTESYASRRNDLITYIEDQILRGVYKTTVSEEKIKDAITGVDKAVKVVRVSLKNGVAEREQSSPFTDFSIKAYNLSIKKLEYDASVESQIQKQQTSASAVQQAIADSRTAEQKALTAKQEALAEAAKLEGAANAKKAEEIAIAEKKLQVAVLTALTAKTNAVLEAQQKLEVAQLATREAEQFKQAEILKGEGEAGRRRAVLAADGALEKKLEAYVSINTAYANALKDYKGAIVPGIIMGGSDKSNGGGVDNFTDMMRILSAKAARDLSLDLNITNR